MLSLRTISRSVPRTLSRSLGLSRAALRPVSILPKPALYQPSKAIKPAYAAFSTSAIARQSPAEGK
jgi:complement component 1 Q subcomponent-binding protein